MSWGSPTLPSNTFVQTPTPPASSFANGIGQGPNFTDSQGLNASFGDLMYDELAYDTPLNTYDYRIGSRPIPNRVWLGTGGNNASWVTEINP